MAVTGTADPVELRHLAEAWPEDIFPTPPEDRRAKDAAAAYVLREMAVPHFLSCADEIENLRALVRYMDRCVQRGGPRNYVEFLDEPLASVLATACTED